MDNSTIIFIILIIFFFLKKTRKCSYNKKENFIGKTLSDKRKNQKNILKVKNKLLKKNELKNIKIDDSISIKNAKEKLKTRKEKYFEISCSK